MKRFPLFILLIAAFVCMAATADEDPVFYSADEQPQFPGGNTELLSRIASRLVFTREMVDSSVSGRMVLQFIVRRNGTIDSVRVLKPLHHLLDSQAAAACSELTGFIPGKSDGKPVSMWYTLPVPITIPDNADVIDNATLIDDVYLSFEDTPAMLDSLYDGGMNALVRYLAMNLNYPEEAAMQNLQGKVVVRFAVNRQGQITYVRTILSVHPLLDREAERVCRSIPQRFKPYIDEKGEAHVVWFTLPVTFALQNGAIPPCGIVRH